MYLYYPKVDIANVIHVSILCEYMRYSVVTKNELITNSK